jgi:hypothetical protein
VCDEHHGFGLRSAALDAWSWHLLGCTVCTSIDGLCSVADELARRLADHLTR